MTDVVAVKYLYQPWMYEDHNGHLVTEVKQLRIVKQTTKRIFFADMFGRTKSIDRQALERDGWVGVGRGTGRYAVYPSRADAEPTPPETPQAKVARLRAEMAAVHPDRGGDPDDFRAAYARYQRAVASTRKDPA